MHPRPIVIAVASLALAGCIEHRARVDNPDGPAHADAAAVAVAIVDPFASPDEVAFTDAERPLDLPVDAWRRDANGAILRWHGRVATPLPWWQRFPCDVVTDLSPHVFVCDAATTVACAPLPQRDAAAVAAAARRDGYGHAAAADHP